MDDMRVAKAFLRKAAVYAEQHGISPVAAVREHDLPAGSQRALQTVKLQVSSILYVLSLVIPASAVTNCLSR